MKKFAKIAAFILAAVLVLSVSACAFGTDSIENIAGTYTMKEFGNSEEAEYLLEYIEAFDEEIALADLDSFYFVKNVHFDMDGSYYFAYDGEATSESVREFYLNYYADLYEGRSTLNEVYTDFRDTLIDGRTFDELSEEEFYQFMADLYSLDSFDELIDIISSDVYDYDSLSEPWETGTFTMGTGQVFCTITGETEAEYLGYEVVDDTLTLTYSDMVEEYTKIG